MRDVTQLPIDGHSHTEFSWDTTDAASMRGSCARAVELGLPALAFTDHLDFTHWRPADVEIGNHSHLRDYLDEDGLLVPPPFPLEEYLASVERCRAEFPRLRIVTGVEFGQPHLQADAAAELLDTGAFERILGSLHVLEVDGVGYEPPGLFDLLPAERVMREYLLEVSRMVATDAPFHVLTHITYAVRHWPSADAGEFRLADFEPEFRAALADLAASGRALEINTRDALSPELLRWFVEEGGTSVTFGSDAHEPHLVGRRLEEAAALAGSLGFQPGPQPTDPWTLRSAG